MLPRDPFIAIRKAMGFVIHQFAQAGFSEEPPKNEQSMLIYAEFKVQPVL